MHIGINPELGTMNPEPFPCHIFLNYLTKLQFSKFFTKLDAPNFKKMNFVGIIPARYESTRLPGKPLVDLGGKPMIIRVFERVKTGPS